MLSESICPVFEKCGGCFSPPAAESNWPLYEKSFETKNSSVLNMLQSVAESQDWPLQLEKAWHPHKKLHYRHKAIYPVVPESLKKGLGFFARGSHEIISHQQCYTHHPEYIHLAKRALEMWKALNLTFYDPRKNKGQLKGLYFRSNPQGEHQLSFLIKEAVKPDSAQLLGQALIAGFATLKSVWFNFHPDNNNVWLGKTWQHIAGLERLTYPLGNQNYGLHPASFFQVNPEGLEYLTTKIKTLGHKLKVKNVLDLFCGVGVLGFSLSAENNFLWGVEANAQAVQEANGYAQKWGLKNAHFIAAPCEEVWPQIKAIAAQKKIDLILLDPPRQGLDASTLQELKNLGATHLIYISCLPKTWWRDGLVLQKMGYRLESWQLMDFFPWTQHLEVFSLWTLE